MKELKNLKEMLDNFSQLESDYQDIETMIEMAEEENDASLVSEIEQMSEAFKQAFETYRIQVLLSGEFDANNAVLTLHAGTGGCHFLGSRHCRQQGKNPACQACRRGDRYRLRKMRQPHGHQKRTLRQICRLPELSRLPQHKADRQGRQCHREGRGSRKHGRDPRTRRYQMRRVRRTDGHSARTLRQFLCLRQLPRMPQYQAHQQRSERPVSALRLEDTHQARAQKERLLQL